MPLSNANYCTVTQNIAQSIPDYEGKFDDVSGRVTITPDIPRGDVWLYSEPGGSNHIIPALPVECEIIDGVLTHNGSPLVRLFAGGANTNPSVVHWRIAYFDLKAGGEHAKIHPFIFKAVPNGTVDLATVTPVSGYTPPGIIMGPKGDRGATGPRGNTGPTGPKGDKGDTGDRGSTGPRGNTGLQGPQGDKGDTGPIGPKGDRGEMGLTGPGGATGSRGPQGLKGDKGDTGSTGARGATGPEGPKGDTGATGPRGIKGDTGTIGPTGARGATGPQGPKGDKGDKGNKGDRGEMGPMGLKGDMGEMPWVGLIHEYNAIVNKDPNRLYIITNN